MDRGIRGEKRQKRREVAIKKIDPGVKRRDVTIKNIDPGVKRREVNKK